jgi:2-polyprenyl-3-methyl-5-hydroxy-6-metoxy-1,4-benzoquinol methylase
MCTEMAVSGQVTTRRRIKVLYGARTYLLHVCPGGAVVPLADLESNLAILAGWTTAFFLPFLKPGVRLLDVRCGLGSITAGLAQRVAAGEAIGDDDDPTKRR